MALLLGFALAMRLLSMSLLLQFLTPPVSFPAPPR